MDVVGVLWNQFGSVFATTWVTMYEFLAGFAIGAAIGLVLAALITQKPFAEKVIAPYILIMVVTPMIALVPFLRLKMGFGSWPLIIAVALASGPMVMLNSATGFRRTDLAKIALARSYGASTFQIFRTIRFPLALPMIIVGFMVGSIFGLLDRRRRRDGGAERGGWARRAARLLLVAGTHGRVRRRDRDRRRTRGGHLRPVLFHRQAMGQLGGLVAPRRRRHVRGHVVAPRGAEARCGGRRGSLHRLALTAGKAFGRSGATMETVRWISPRGTLQVMDDFNLWVPLKMGYFKTLGIEAKLIAGSVTDARIDEVRRAEQGRHGLPVARRADGVDRQRHGRQVDLGRDLGSGLQLRPAREQPSSRRRSSRGKSIALGSSGWKVIVDPMLVELGIDPKSVRYVAVGASWMQAVATGKADAGLAWEGLRAHSSRARA